ncbi:MAG: hypothetical protein IIY52_03345 [Solobacterium sp.]|nr:hypothetical protein [Solobacterium sp.]
MKKYSLLKCTAVLSLILSAGCTAAGPAQESAPAETVDTSDPAESQETSIVSTAAGTITADSVFTDRDLEQTADLSQAIVLDVEDNQEITISKEGIYLQSGTATE